MHLIPPPQPEYWVLSLSGGKDSTALGLEWLKRHQQDPVTYPLHEVIYCDTGMEFPAMAEHINRLEQIFIGAEIRFTRLKSEKTFEWYMFDYYPKRSNPALKDKSGWSWPGQKPLVYQGAENQSNQQVFGCLAEPIQHGSACGACR